VAQGVGPEFNPQYHRKKKKRAEAISHEKDSFRVFKKKFVFVSVYILL
jgi:hypothetical protein